MKPGVSPLLMPRRRLSDPTAAGLQRGLPEVFDQLRGVGVPLDDQAFDEATKTCSPVPLGDLFRPTVGPGLVGPAWRRIMDDARYPLLSVAVVVELLERSPAASSRSLSSVNIYYDRTLAYARAMYGIRLYEHAREMYKQQLDYGLRGYVIARRQFDLALTTENLLSAETCRRVNGMYGVASLILARSRATGLADLALARDRLAKSMEFGNTGPEASAYLADLYVLLFDVSGDISHLERGIAIVASEADGLNDPAQLRLTAGELYLRLLAHRDGVAFAAACKAFRAQLGAARRLRTSNEVDDMRAAMLEMFLNAYEDASGSVLRALPVRGLALPFGWRLRLAQMHRRRDEALPSVVKEVVQCLKDLIPSQPSPKLTLELISDLLALEARVMHTGDPQDAAAALREGIEARSRVVALDTNGRMTRWLLGSQYRELFALTGEPRAAAQAATHLAAAAELDDAWPVPVAALADMATDSRVARSLGSPSSDLLALVSAGDSEALYELATARSLRNHEFEQRVLGGRSDVFVVDDARGLLAGALVFKRMGAAAAERERATAEVLRAAVDVRGLGARFTTFRSLAIVPLPEGDPRRSSQVNSVHVMRRENGRLLSEMASRSMAVGASVDLSVLREVLLFLALFHSSSGLSGADEGRFARKAQRNNLKMWLTAVLGREEALEMRDRWEGSIPEGAPVVAKRDAHPGNWLVTPAGRVVALDLESVGHLPVLMEVAQLIEDGPCIPVDDSGWAIRDDLVKQYWGHLRALGLALTDAPSAQSYQAYAAYRAVMLVSRPRKWSPLQVRHARALLTYLATNAEAESLQEFARRVLQGAEDTVDEPPTVPSAGMMQLDDRRRTRLSRATAFFLRHGGAESALARDGEGWVAVDDLVGALRTAHRWVDARAVESMALSPDEKRFELRHGKIRALYGHSVAVQLPPESIDLPEVLYHGTSWENLGRILASGGGLLPMGRNAVHLSTDIPSAHAVGSRHGKPVVFGVRTEDLLQAGIAVRAAGVGVWLTSEVPAPLLFIAQERPADA